ncbi:phosphotransferase [Phytohabitans sp. ZYX-F-186]|uniref:Phosphotransferase n=1 Tax=Phytohabitans maris TaxID=3071409 RepID=A0ABU0ZRA2_9ACTN|nr:phosphotransferase [Phytohabitans sp. ZYX-F-186]MDQ7909553.1 phosphotransferase [Phytohabitans sp. ZYX-F-186]
MNTPPHELAEARLASALTAGWGLAVASLAYRPVGFGSHHWELVDAGGGRWFVTVDDLRTKRYAAGEPLDRAYERLRDALGTAVALGAHGLEFVVAPEPTVDGAALSRVDDRFTVAVYRYVDGESFGWGDFASGEQRLAVLGMVVALHGAPPAAGAGAAVDDLRVPGRADLEAALAGDVPDAGPYARRMRDLLAARPERVRELLADYDALAAEVDPARWVLTHGEPHPGNTMRAAGRWRLIDWDTVLRAAPERDLWSLDPGDGSILAAYEAATGVRPRLDLLELFRLRWEAADLAAAASRFRAPHAGDADDDATWDILAALAT